MSNSKMFLSPNVNKGSYTVTPKATRRFTSSCFGGGGNNCTDVCGGGSSSGSCGSSSSSLQSQNENANNAASTPCSRYLNPPQSLQAGLQVSSSSSPKYEYEYEYTHCYNQRQDQGRLPVVSPTEFILAKDAEQVVRSGNYINIRNNNRIRNRIGNDDSDHTYTATETDTDNAICNNNYDSYETVTDLAPIIFPLVLNDDINDLKKKHSKFISQFLSSSETTTTTTRTTTPSSSSYLLSPKSGPGSVRVPSKPVPVRVSVVSDSGTATGVTAAAATPKTTKKITRKTLQPVHSPQPQHQTQPRPQKLLFVDDEDFIDISADTSYRQHASLFSSVLTPSSSPPSPSCGGDSAILMKHSFHSITKTMTKEDDDNNDNYNNQEINDAAKILCKIKTDRVNEKEQWSFLPTSGGGTKIYLDLTNVNKEEQQEHANKTFTPSSLLMKRKMDDFDNIHAVDTIDTFLMSEKENESIYDQVTIPKKKKIKKNKTLPNRLALPQDSNEVNSLHCYVRSDLLELFVVSFPYNDNRGTNDNRAITTTTTTTNEKGYSSLGASSSLSSCERKTRSRLQSDVNGTRSDTTTSSTSTLDNKKKTVSSLPSSTNRRYIPGRVGLRCVHCKSHQMKKQSQTNTNDAATATTTTTTTSSTTIDATKPDFFPRSIHQLYREVCTWQRVHFQHCPYVPKACRDKYRHLKESDKTRGKTRYWETSARAIGLVDVFTANGEHDGIRFT